MTDELYNKIVCALTHRIEVCDECMKCGLHGTDARMNIISQISKECNKPLPWDNNTEEDSK